MMGWRRRIRPMVAAGLDKSAPGAHFWALLGTYLGNEAKSMKYGGQENYLGLSEQSVTPGFTIDNLCKALGVHRNYSFLPLYVTNYFF